MTTFTMSDEWIAELSRLEEMAQAGVPCLPSPKFLAEFVRLQRGMRQWKQETLASFANISLSTVERIERGEAVSKDSLDQVAIALGYEAGDFTTPRVPLGAAQSVKRLEETFARFNDRVAVPVRPLRKQPQVSALAQCEYFLVDGSNRSQHARPSRNMSFAT